MVTSILSKVRETWGVFLYFICLYFLLLITWGVQGGGAGRRRWGWDERGCGTNRIRTIEKLWQKPFEGSGSGWLSKLWREPFEGGQDGKVVLAIQVRLAPLKVCHWNAFHVRKQPGKCYHWPFLGKSQATLPEAPKARMCAVADWHWSGAAWKGNSPWNICNSEKHDNSL